MKILKNFSKLLCLFIVLGLMLSACSGVARTDQSSSNRENTSGELTTESKDTSKTEKMVFVSIGWGEKSRDFDLVVNRLNEMSKEKINVEIALNIINASTYSQQLNIMMAGGEDMDLLFIPFGNGKNTMVSQNQLMAVNDLLEQYGQGITNALGDLIHYGETKGNIYAIPFNGSKLYPNTIAVREDILEKYSLNLDEVKNYKDLAKLFDVVKKNEPDLVCIAPNLNDLLTGYAMGDQINKIDELGDKIGVLIGNDNYNLVNVFETEEYKDILNTMRDWYNKGYILKDAATTGEVGSVMYNQGKLFSYIYVDVLDDLDKAYHHAGLTQQGQPTKVKALNKPIINSSWGFYSVGISSQSKHPDTAMKWLNFMYEDAEALNTIYWGIEGKHFVKNDDGTISYAPGEEGVNCGYSTSFNWMFGNTTLSYCFQTNGDADYFAKRVNQNNTAEYSIAFGFFFDTTPVKAQYTAVSNVISQYKRALESGSVDPTIELPNFIAKLKEVGIDEVIAEKQDQLNEWVAERKTQ